MVGPCFVYGFNPKKQEPPSPKCGGSRVYEFGRYLVTVMLFMRRDVEVVTSTKYMPEVAIESGSLFV